MAARQRRGGGPRVTDAMVRRALEAALGGRVPGTQRALNLAERNKRLIEAGETFAGRKPLDYRRKPRRRT